MLFVAAVRPPSPGQGLLIARAFYQSLGGHSGGAADPEADLLRRIGGQRLITLRARATPADT
jgi:hypothetical protein